MENHINKKEIAEKLIALGETKFDKPGNEGGKLASNLKDYPHAYVLACILDRQIEAGRAWKAPDELKCRIGHFHFQKLKKLSISDWEGYLKKPTPLHRFYKEMAVCFYEAVQLIAEKYNGDASKIWEGKPSSGEIVCCFLEFRGVGQKIAAMATRILKEKGIPMSDYRVIDVAVDVHIKKVFYRLGLISRKDKDMMAICVARELQPEFPAILDYPTWEIGRKWCKPQKPLCKNCPMDEICPKIGVSQSAD